MAWDDAKHGDYIFSPNDTQKILNAVGKFYEEYQSKQSCDIMSAIMSSRFVVQSGDIAVHLGLDIVGILDN